METTETQEITAEQAAEILGYHINHVYRLLGEGTLPARKFSRAWIIKLSDVEALKEKQDQYGRLPKRED